jgi:hypothetical protein
MAKFLAPSLLPYLSSFLLKLQHFPTRCNLLQFATRQLLMTIADGRKATWIIKPGHKWFCYVPWQVADSSPIQLSLIYIIFWTSSWGRSVCGFACTKLKGPRTSTAVPLVGGWLFLSSTSITMTWRFKSIYIN